MSANPPAKPPKPQPTPGSPAAHQIEVDRLTLKNDRLTAQLKLATDELEFAKKSLKKIENTYKARIANALKLDIQDVLRCSPNELAQLTHNKTIEELEAMLEHVMLARTSDPTDPKKATYKPIRVDAMPLKYGEPANMTVPNIFGKTRSDVLKMMRGEQ